MRVAEIMTRHVETIAPQMRGDEAWELMRRKRIRHLVVVENGAVAGVLSERDAGGISGASLRAQSIVADLMTGAVATIASDATVRKAANLMRGRTIGCLPVVDDQKVPIPRGATATRKPMARRSRNSRTRPWQARMAPTQE